MWSGQDLLQQLGSGIMCCSNIADLEHIRVFVCVRTRAGCGEGGSGGRELEQASLRY